MDTRDREGDAVAGRPLTAASLRSYSPPSPEPSPPPSRMRVRDDRSTREANTPLSSQTLVVVGGVGALHGVVVTIVDGCV